MLNFNDMIWRKLPLGLYRIFGPNISAALGRLPLGNWMLHRLRTVERCFLLITLPNPIVADGQSMYWNPRACVYASAFASGKYELDTRLLLESLLRPGMVVVDLGAYLGYFSLIAAKHVGEKGKVYAFEPDPTNYALLLKNIRANHYDNIIIAVQKAVSSQGGSVPLFLSEQEGSGTSLYQVSSSGTRSVMIEATTLDEFFESEGWPPVHVIKMDVEGAEKAALEGMKQLVERNQSLKLIMEFSPPLQAAVGISPEELFNTLSGLGFQKFWALHNGMHSINLPEDIPRLVQIAGDSCVNIYCER